MRIELMLCTTNAIGASQFRPIRRKPTLSSVPGFTFLRWNLCDRRRLWRQSPVRNATAQQSDLRSWRGESQLRVFPNQTSGTPLTDSKAELPPVIRRAEVVAFALVALLVISIVVVLYAAKAFFLPVVTAFVVGTMLSPAARYLERHRIPRAVSAVLIVIALVAAVAFIGCLISSPLKERSS